jgi:glycosyltransferase involved in cell wall biosynthesis
MSRTSPYPGGVPTVSIVVAAYNPGSLLALTLDSIVAQTYDDWECVVVDDGSDEPLEWVPAVDPRIRLLQQPNAGVGAARNRGIASTRGPLIAFCDQDDEWLPTKLERQVAAFSSGGLCYTGFERVDLAGLRLGDGYRGPRGYEELLTGNGICASTVMIRRRVLDGGFDNRLPLGLGWDLWLRIAREHPIVPVDEVLARYREHPNQATRDYKVLWRDGRTILDRHEHPNAAAGRRRVRELSGIQAFDRARETRGPRHFLYAMAHAPRYTIRNMARWVRSFVR